MYMYYMSYVFVYAFVYVLIYVFVYVFLLVQCIVLYSWSSACVCEPPYSKFKLKIVNFFFSTDSVTDLTNTVEHKTVFFWIFFSFIIVFVQCAYAMCVHVQHAYYVLLLVMCRCMKFR